MAAALAFRVIKPLVTTAETDLSVVSFEHTVAKALLEAANASELVMTIVVAAAANLTVPLCLFIVLFPVTPAAVMVPERLSCAERDSVEIDN